MSNSTASPRTFDKLVATARHPSVAGSYLAACVTYATLFKPSPVGLKDNADLDSTIARHLQTVAWETVQEYFKP